MNSSKIITAQPLCSACNQEITSKAVFALSKMWHPEHFQCKECQKPITSDKFYERDGWPYCENDYNLLFQIKCAECNQPITDSYVNALGKTWHAKHFYCIECKNPLLGSTFMEKEGNPYCQYDYQRLFAIKCYACGQPIIDFAMIALGKNWHKECLICQICRKNTPLAIKDEIPMCYNCMMNKNQ